MARRLIAALCFITVGGLLTWPPAPLYARLSLAYADTLYPLIQSSFSQLPGVSRYALMDVLWLLLLLLFSLRVLMILLLEQSRRLRSLMVEVILWCSAGYLSYLLLWGLNYQQPALYQQLFLQGYRVRLNDSDWQRALTLSQNAVASLPDEFDPCDNQPRYFQPARAAAFAHVANARAGLPTSPSRRVVESGWSWLYTRLSVAGVYWPFTAEPTINGQSFELSKPFLMLHEYAHFAGYAREYDADIQAYHAAWQAPDPIWQYSGWLVWWHSVNAPAAQRQRLPASLQRGLLCYQTHLNQQPRWQIRRLAWRVYETNLKSQGVSEGLASYSMGESMALTSLPDGSQ